jgi:hypothetical protein
MPDRRGRGALPTSRRDRWRVVIVVGVVLLVLLFVGEVIDQVVDTSSSVGKRTDKTWVAATTTIVDELDTLTPTFHAIRAHATDASEFNRVTLEFALGELTRGTTTDETTYESLGLAAPSPGAGALMAGVLRLRREGAADLARGIELATSARTGPSPLPRATKLLVTAGSCFIAADAGYHALVVSLRGDVNARSLPPSAWVQTPGVWSAASVGAWANALRSASSLVFAPAISIVAVTLVPPPLEITGLPTTTTTTTTTTLPTTTTTIAAATTSTTVATIAAATTSTTVATTTTAPAAKSHARRQQPATTTTAATTTSTTTVSTGSSKPAGNRATTTTTTLPLVTTSLQIPPAGSTSVVAATTRLEVVVIVKNTGDTTAHGANVTSVLEPSRSSHTGAARVSCRHKLSVLAPGVSEYVVMPKLAVKHATDYELVVTASIPGGPPDTRSIALYVSV